MGGILKFIGTGSAFNTKLGCNSAYIKKNKSILFFDFGGDVFGKTLELNILKDVENIIILITHTHPDHVGSLGDVIYYTHYILGKKATIICDEPKLRMLLEIQGVSERLYDFINTKTIISINDINFGLIDIKSFPTIHSKNVNSFGYIARVEGRTIYYSGDCNGIPEEVLRMLENNNIDEFYQDTCGLEYLDNPHMYIGILEDIIAPNFRNKLFCMHIDEALNVNDVREKGFNVVESIKMNDMNKTSE